MNEQKDALRCYISMFVKVLTLRQRRLLRSFCSFPHHQRSHLIPHDHQPAVWIDEPVIVNRSTIDERRATVSSSPRSWWPPPLLSLVSAPGGRAGHCRSAPLSFIHLIESFLCSVTLFSPCSLSSVAAF